MTCDCLALADPEEPHADDCVHWDLDVEVDAYAWAMAEDGLR
ncbi:hypothetical protein ABT160_02475 [Streptomyces sp. NPDC001941]